MTDTPAPRSAQDSRPALIASIGGGPPRKFTGRPAWALEQLVRAGRAGLTTLERPAPRWSDYIFKLRRGGVPIVTEHEPHGGPFSGSHGRYRLTVPVEILEGGAA